MACNNGDHSGTTRYQCQKHLTEVCEECLGCKDPTIYCKFRPSCVIHFLEKERKNEHRQAV